MTLGKLLAITVISLLLALLFWVRAESWWNRANPAFAIYFGIAALLPTLTCFAGFGRLLGPPKRFIDLEALDAPENRTTVLLLRLMAILLLVGGVAAIFVGENQTSFAGGGLTALIGWRLVWILFSLYE
jgi:magnesium-transporting ATPase (P-type)